MAHLSLVAAIRQLPLPAAGKQSLDFGKKIEHHLIINIHSRNNLVSCLMSWFSFVPSSSVLFCLPFAISTWQVAVQAKERGW
jgi:hypothetical protein